MAVGDSSSSNMLQAEFPKGLLVLGEQLAFSPPLFSFLSTPFLLSLSVLLVFQR